MNEQARQKLRDLIVHQGRSLCNEPERCKGLLQDACPTSQREIFVLVSALEEQVVTDLQAGLGGRSWDAAAGRLTRRLVDNRALADHAAFWAVESWDLALAVITPAAASNSFPPQPSPGPPAAPDSGVITTRTAQITLKLIRPASFGWARPRVVRPLSWDGSRATWPGMRCARWPRCRFARIGPARPHRAGNVPHRG